MLQFNVMEVVATLYQLDVPGSTRITTCHSLHIPYLHKSS